MTDLTEIALAAVLARVRTGTTTDDDAVWLREHIEGLKARRATAGVLAYALEGLIKDTGLTHEERIEMANRWLAGLVLEEETDDADH